MAADGSRYHRQRYLRANNPLLGRTKANVAPPREHSVMVVRACGREWVLRSWSPKK